MSESLDKATPLELDMLILQKKISQGDLENISIFSEEILNRSRSVSYTHLTLPTIYSV